MARLGGRCSILSGLIYIISGVVFFVYQVGRFDWNSIASISAYFQAFPQAVITWGIVNIGATCASFLAIAGVLALSDRLKPVHEGFVHWTSTLAVIGYSISAITNVADYDQIKKIATGYPLLDPSARSALEVIGIGSLDPTLILQFMTLGSWFLIAGWLSIRRGLLPKPLAWLGFVGGIVSLGSVVVSVLEIQSLAMLTLVAALVFHPIWLIWTGLVLWQERQPAWSSSSLSFS